MTLYERLTNLLADVRLKKVMIDIEKSTLDSSFAAATLKENGFSLKNFNLELGTGIIPDTYQCIFSR